MRVPDVAVPLATYGGLATLTGTLLSVVEPLPSWPLPFEPQQYVSAAVTPQV